MTLSIRQGKQSQNLSRPKSADKVRTAVKHHQKLLARVKSKENSAWLSNALKLSTEKMKKYGMTHLVVTENQKTPQKKALIPEKAAA